MSNLRNLKKDINFLCQDLNQLISVKVLVEGVELSKFNEAITEVASYRADFLAKAKAPAISAPKFADRKATPEQKAAVKTAYAKAVKAAYAQINKSLIEQYAAIADKISNIK